MNEDAQSDADLEDLSIKESTSLLSRTTCEAQYPATTSQETATERPLTERRQSSLSPLPPDGAPRAPRTTNRVRFEIEVSDRSAQALNVPICEPALRTAEDGYFSYDSSNDIRRSTVQRVPLLTGIEAPSVTVANSGFDFNAEDLLETSRPKSGMRSAFMNMANSIIGAGIIGQPYAFRQAGLTMGVILLLVLTITVDWTIRLIVVNSKLSGTDSFQATMEHYHIVNRQPSSAFGGMLAFCIIIGDTIPHVMSAVFPSLSDVPFLWLLTNRRAVIIIFILGVSYPLSLYRDIAKVWERTVHAEYFIIDQGQLAKASSLALLSMLVILISLVTQGATVPSELRGAVKGSLWTNPGVFQAIGVISFALGGWVSHDVLDHNSLLIYGSLRKPTMDRFARVTHYSTVVSMVACLTMATAGFLTFGDRTKGNVLNNFPTANVVVNIARL
ncbi:MAG: hypothetical protein LQ341_002152 [Variospora aurantia]|nr:MAG: hypothetical protein LQ341_002152 [Variospora aurantia]